MAGWAGQHYYQSCLQASQRKRRYSDWKHSQHVWTPDDLTLVRDVHSQYTVSPTAQALTGTDTGPWLRNTRWQLLRSFSQHGLATLYSSEKLLKLFPYVLRNRCCGVWITPTSFLRKWITLADIHVNALLSKREVRLRGTRYKLIINIRIKNPNHREYPMKPRPDFQSPNPFLSIINLLSFQADQSSLGSWGNDSIFPLQFFLAKARECQPLQWTWTTTLLAI